MFFQTTITWILQLLARIPEAMLIGFLLNRKIRGREFVREAERIQRKQKVGVIFAMNHESTFDPIIFLPGISPFSNLAPMFYMVRSGRKYKNEVASMWQKFLYGELFFFAWGGIVANPGHADYDTTLAQHIKFLKAGKSLCIFPEGKIQRESDRGEARGGITFLAEQTGALIVPVHIGGIKNLKEEEFWARSRRTTITFGKPFFLSEFEPYDKGDIAHFRALSEKILDRIYGIANL
jgi:1-acyl-sn-glycerol-3-phosphate acyltransferase